jgi:hypothetical protein
MPSAPSHRASSFGVHERECGIDNCTTHTSDQKKHEQKTDVQTYTVKGLGPHLEERTPWYRVERPAEGAATAHDATASPNYDK